MNRVAGAKAGVRIRSQFKDQKIEIAVEQETPRWRGPQTHKRGAANGQSLWELAPLQARMDEVMTEALPWGARLTLRKRLDPFDQVTR